MENTKNAKLYLGLNAGFSFITGIECLFYAEPIAKLLLSNPQPWHSTILSGLGAGLILFSILLVFITKSRQLKKRLVIDIVIADIAWLIGSALLIIFFQPYFTLAGMLIIVAVGVFVAIFAAGQYISAQQLQTHP